LYLPKLYISLLLVIASNVCLAQITASFQANQQEVCTPDVVQFSDASVATAAPIVQWTWSRNGTVFSNLPNPALLFNTAGSYQICLTVVDSLGNSDTICQNNYIQAYRSPTADFLAPNRFGCSPLNVHFSDSSLLGDAPIQQWRWDFGDGTIDTVNQHPTHLYTTTGTFDVTLVVIDTNGCSHSLLLSNYITVTPPLNVAITHNANNPACGIPATIQFNGISTNSSGGTYIWNFDDGNFDIGQSITHNYLASGCYSPTLTVTSGGCMATATIPSCINIRTKPTADFSLLDTAACYIPFSPAVSNLSSGANSYLWNFGDSTYSNLTNPTHTYTTNQTADTANFTNGVFPITLIAYSNNGCTDTTQRIVYISNMRAGLTTPAVICAPDTIGYYANISYNSIAFYSTSLQWTLDNGPPSTSSSAYAVYPDSGIYNIQLVVEDNLGCRDTVQETVEVGLVPTIDSFVVQPPVACRIDGVQLQAFGSSYIDQWTWSFNDQSSSYGDTVQHVFQDTGQVTGSLAASFRGCTASIPLDTYYVLPPIAKFEPIVDCDTLLVHFADSSIGAHRWYWDFGDTTTLTDTSTLQHPSYLYPSLGTYQVRLIVYNDSTNCYDEYVFPVVLDDPQANFTIIDSVCAPADVRPTILPPTQSDDLMTWYSSGGPINYPTADTPTLRFNIGGIFNVRLTVSDVNGCTATANRTIHVAGISPNISHSPNPTCRPTNVTYTDASTAVLSPITSWQWSTGSNNNTTNVFYSFPGEASVSLTLTNDWGCTYDLEKEIKVGGLFTNFSITRNICIGNNATANAILTSPANADAFPPYTFVWDYGDGVIDTTTAYTSYHKYLQAGVYDVCLTVIDSLGCTSTICKNDWVEVHDPRAIFTADTFYSSCPPLEVNFSNLSLSGTAWSWTFGDGSVSSLENPTHVYSTPGFYDVSLAVTAFAGCTGADTIQQMIQIDGPRGDFSMPPTVGCSPVSIEMTAAGINIATYTWLYGNGDFDTHNTNAATDTTQYTYTQAGTYVPVLVIDDGMGCQIPIEKDTVVVLPTPTPLFSADSISCQGDSIQFQLLSTLSTNSQIEWYFEGGFPDTSTLSSPTVYYPDSGNFDVQLIVWEDGCSDTLLKQDFIQIKAPPLAAFDIIRADSCIPTMVSFADSSKNTDGFIQSWQWDLDNNTSATSQDTTAWYLTADTFDIQLAVQNNFGCRDTSQQTFITYPLPTVQITPPPTPCAGDSIQLTATGSGSFLWISNAWLSDSATANPITVVDSTESYILQATNLWGCQQSDTIAIQTTPWIYMNAGDSLAICLGDSVQLQGNSNLSTGFDWGTSTSLSCQYCSTPIASPSATTTYVLQSTDSTICKETDSVVVYVFPLPQAAINADSSICEGDTLQLTATGGGQYQWIGGTPLSSDTIANPTTTPITPSNYIVVVSDSNGCKNTASIGVAIRSSAFVPLPNDTICLGDSLQLALTPNNSNPIWSGQALSCTHCLSTTAAPDTASLYWVQYYNNDNCPVRDSLQISVIDLNDLTAYPSDSICLGDSLQLAVSGHNNQQVQWSPYYNINNNNTTTPTVFPAVDTQYIVEVQAGKCFRADTVSIFIENNVAINAIGGEYCIGDTIQLMAYGNAERFEWFPSIGLNNDTTAAPLVFVANSQQYQVIGYGNCGLDTAFAQVSVQSPPSIQLDTGLQVPFGTTVTLNDTILPNMQYIWSPADRLSCAQCPQPTHTVRAGNVFYVTVIDSLGCWTRDSIWVRPISNCVASSVFIPNAFTPNNDGHNDKLWIRCGRPLEIEAFQIYDRWGKMVFETKDIAIGWDGRFKNKALPPDVYGYYLLFRCPDTGEKILKKGNVTILR